MTAFSWLIPTSAALLGLVLALALAPVLQLPASPGELPSALQAQGLSARGPALQWMAIVVLPFLAALAAGWRFAKRSELAAAEPLRVTPRAVIYAVLLPAYLLTLLGVFTPVPVDFFEDGHDLLPASEMLRGELPYRDILPMHGLVSDGGLSWLALKIGGEDMGTALKTRRVVAALTITAIFLVGFAATGSAEAGLLAALLMIVVFPATTMGVRVLPALLALAAICAAIRRGVPQWLVPALCAVSFAFSIDFAIYSTLVALAVALWTRAWRMAAALAILLLAALGAFWPVLADSSVYVMTKLALPACSSSFDPHCISAAVWFVALIYAAVMLAARRVTPAVAIAMWVVVAGLSYVERRHFYYEYAVPPLLIAWLYPRKKLLPILLLVVVVKSFTHVRELALPLVLRPDPIATPVAGMPRTEGAVLDETQRRALEVMRRIPLRSGDTFYDFANASILYYLTNRDCPVPWMEVPQYESEERQRQVIATLESDRRIAAVLLAFPGAQPVIDGIDNKIRAPLVWSHVEKHYEPWIDEAGVVMWRRRRQP